MPLQVMLKDGQVLRQSKVHTQQSAAEGRDWLILKMHERRRVGMGKGEVHVFFHPKNMTVSHVFLFTISKTENEVIVSNKN